MFMPAWICQLEPAGICIFFHYIQGCAVAEYQFFIKEHSQLMWFSPMTSYFSFVWDGAMYDKLRFISIVPSRYFVTYTHQIRAFNPVRNFSTIYIASIYTHLLNSDSKEGIIGLIVTKLPTSDQNQSTYYTSRLIPDTH